MRQYFNIITVGFLLVISNTVSASATQLTSLPLKILATNTLIAIALVALGVLMIGGGLAWLTTHNQFPGRKLFSKLLILPLAIPSYILGFMLMDITDSWALPTFSISDNLLSSSTLLALVKTCLLYIATLYPLVYLPAQNLFKNLQKEQLENRYIKALSKKDIFFHILLPKFRASILAGVLLSLLIVLSDFATPSLTGFPTLASSIYNAWEQDPNSGISWLPAIALMIMSLMLFLILKVLGGKTTADYSDEPFQAEKKLQVISGISASLLCSLVLFITLILPFIQLFSRLDTRQINDNIQALLPYLSHSISLSLTASIATVCLAILIIVNIKSRILVRGFSYIIILFSSAPMPLLVMVVLFFQQGLPALMMVYIIHLLPVVIGIIKSGNLHNILRLSEVTESLGLSYFKKIHKVYLPIIGSDLRMALIVTMFIVLRELPASYFLLQTGWETLAVQCFKLIRDGSTEQGAIAASLVILTSLLPIMWLNYKPSALSRTI